MKLFSSQKTRNNIVVLALTFTLLGLVSCQATKQCKQDARKVKKMRKSGQIKM